MAEGRTSWLDADARRPADRCAPCCRTGSAPPSSRSRRRGSTRPSQRASRSRCCSRLTLVLHLVRQLSPRAHRASPAAAVRVRRRGRRRRLRARHRRRRPARADRLARPAAARPRDHARAGAARRPCAVPAMALAAAPFRPLARAAGACCSRCRRWPPAARRAIGGCCSASAGAVICVALELRGRRAASAPWVAAATLLAAPRRRLLGAVGVARRRRRCRRARCCSVARQLALVPVAGLAARAVDAVALAPSPAHRHIWRAAGGAVAGAGRLPG